MYLTKKIMIDYERHKSRIKVKSFNDFKFGYLYGYNHALRMMLKQIDKIDVDSEYGNTFVETEAVSGNKEAGR